MMRQICVSPSVVVRAACLLVVFLVPRVDCAGWYGRRQDTSTGAGLATDRRGHRHRYLREPAAQAASSAADIKMPSAHINRKRRESSTICAECNQAAITRAADPSQGNGQAATNSYERSDEKQDATASATNPEQDAGRDEIEDANPPSWSYFEPTLQPTLEADIPDASAYWTQTREDDNKVAESLEEGVGCQWCHDDEVDRRPDGPASGDGGFPDKSFPDDPYDYPKASPDSYRDNNQGYGGSGASSYDHRLIDDMVAPFFLLAAVLLILALVYTLLFLCVVRLGTIRIDEDRYPRGRVYFCGSFCFVPLCWFYRLYAADPSGSVGIASTSDARVMGLRREERKEAVTELLKQYSTTVGEGGGDGETENAGVTSASQLDHNIASNTPPTKASASTADTEPEVTATAPTSGEDSDNADLEGADENQCSICLDGYGE